MKHFLLIFAILIMLVVAGCLREVETTGGGTKTEPLSPEEKSEPPPEPPTNTPVQPKTEPKVDTAPKTEPKAEARKPNELVAWVSDLSDPNNVKIEKAIRKAAKKPTGNLTKADLEKPTRLSFYNNQLTNVKGLEKLTQLTSLWLHKNKLTDVKGLENLDQLETLRLSDNQLTDVKGLEKLTKLTGLDLDGNQLTDLKGLEKLTKLKELWLRGNPDLTKAQIDQLQKALPKCAISSNPTK